jgi:lysophospholipase L1-like esterase
MRVGAGVALSALGGVTVLGVEILLARQRTYLTAESAPPVTGEFGDAADPLVRLVLLGDSTAAGVGVSRTQDTVGAQLAMRLSTERLSVRLSGVAVSGSRAGDLSPQVGRALVMTDRPDVAVVIIGANDATHVTPLDAVARDVEAAVRRLRAAGIAVVVATAPDMGAPPALARPLRDLVAWRARHVAARSEQAATRAGGLVVDLAAETGPAFRADPERLHSSDLFHPSAAGYRVWADALLPAVRRAVAARQPERG